MEESIKELLQELIAKVESDQLSTSSEENVSIEDDVLISIIQANPSVSSINQEEIAVKDVEFYELPSANNNFSDGYDEEDINMSLDKTDFDIKDTMIQDDFYNSNDLIHRNINPVGTSAGINDNVNGSIDNEQPLSEDVRNLLFSHFPKYLGTKFRFKVGELVYLQWHDELCLVVINFASQKLVACNDNTFYEKDDSDDYEGVRSTIETSKTQILDCSKIPGVRRTVWLHDNNENLFTDVDSHNLYSRLNALKPMRLSFSNDEDYDYKFPKDDYESLLEPEARRMVMRYYFIPIYYVTFPGYKRKCAKTFRFWVKEKDLIKFNSVKWHNRLSMKPEINLNIDSGKTKHDRTWCKRDVEPVNEYVYSVKHNRYFYEVVSGFYSSGMFIQYKHD